MSIFMIKYNIQCSLIRNLIITIAKTSTQSMHRFLLRKSSFFPLAVFVIKISVPFQENSKFTFSTYPFLPDTALPIWVSE